MPSCPMCLREDLKLTRHHLIPKTMHKKKAVQKLHEKDLMLTSIVEVCRSCHNQIHATLSERELACEYFTTAKLFAHPEISKYRAWIQDRRVGGRVSVRRNKNKR